MASLQQTIERWTSRWSWMATIPTTNAKTFSTMCLDWATALISFWMFLKAIQPTAAYDAWLVFLGALNGFAITQFGIKRTTDIDYQNAKNAQPVPPNVTVQGPPPAVVVQPATQPDVVEPPAPVVPAAPLQPDD